MSFVNRRNKGQGRRTRNVFEIQPLEQRLFLTRVLLGEIDDMNVTGGTSTMPFLARQGVTYELQAHGTALIKPSSDPADPEEIAYHADAEFTRIEDEAPTDSTQDNAAVDVGIGVDGQAPAWGAYQSSHVYTKAYVGKQVKPTFRFHDSALGDNVNDGGMGVRIFGPEQFVAEVAVYDPANVANGAGYGYAGQTLYVEQSANGWATLRMAAGNGSGFDAGDFTDRAFFVWSVTPVDGGGGWVATPNGTHTRDLNADPTIKLARGTGSGTFEVSSGFDLNGDGRLQGNEAQRTVTVQLLKVTDLAARDSRFDNAEATVTATNTTVKDLYVGEVGDTGSVTLALAGLMSGGDLEFSPGAWEKLRYSVVGDNVTNPDGHFAWDDEAAVTLTPTGSNRTFDVYMGFDNDASGDLAISGEVDRHIRVHVIKLNSLKAEDHTFGTRAKTNHGKATTTELYLERADNGTAVVDLTANIASNLVAPGPRVLWQIEGTTSTPNPGTFAATPSITLNPHVTNTNRKFIVSAGVDLNGDGQLGYGINGYDEVTHEIVVYVVRVQDVFAWDAAYAKTLQNTVTARDSTAVDLFIEQNLAGETAVRLDVTHLPQTPEAGQNIRWQIDAAGASPMSGHFGADDLRIVLPVTDELREFTLQLGFDDNANGSLDANSFVTEIARTVKVHAVKIDQLTVADVHHSERTAEAATTAAVDMLLGAIAEGADYGKAKVKLHLTHQAPGATVGQHLVWSVEGNDTDSATIVDHRFGGTAPEVTLTPTGGNYDFVVRAGFDNNGNGVLDEGEGDRTLNIHMFQVEFEKTYSDQFADMGANYLAGHTGRGRASADDYILMGMREDGRAHAKADLLYKGSEAARNAIKFHIARIDPDNDEGDWTVVPSHSVDGQVLRVDAHVGGYVGNFAEDAKIVYGADFNGDGKFSKNEIVGWDKNLFKVVTQGGYAAAQSHLSDLGTVWNNTGLTHSANFLYAFRMGYDLANTTAVESSTVQTQEDGYSHNVGALFDADGTAPIKKYVFGPSTQLAQDVAASGHIRDYIRETLQARKSEIIAAFANSPIPSTLNFTDWSVDKSGVDFDAIQDPDLKFSIGRGELSNLKIDFTVEHVIETITEYDMNGIPYTRTFDTYQATSVSVNGTVSDLYDFDYDADYASSAASVQAGYGTMSSTSGSGGKVFRTEVNMSGNALGGAPVYIHSTEQ